jgi:hypothetical protein
MESEDGGSDVQQEQQQQQPSDQRAHELQRLEQLKRFEGLCATLFRDDGGRPAPRLPPSATLDELASALTDRLGTAMLGDLRVGVPERLIAMGTSCLLLSARTHSMQHLLMSCRAIQRCCRTVGTSGSGWQTY